MSKTTIQLSLEEVVDLRDALGSVLYNDQRNNSKQVDVERRISLHARLNQAWYRLGGDRK